MPGMLAVVTSLWAYALTHLVALATQPADRPAELLAGAAVAAAATLLTVAIAMRIQVRPSASADPTRRAMATRSRTWGGRVPRQLDPDAAGRPRPRAPSAYPSAA